MSNKHIISVQAVSSYADVGALREKRAVETRAFDGNVIVEWSFKARDALGAGVRGIEVERPLYSIARDFDQVIPKELQGESSPTHAYVSGMKVVGSTNTSPWTVDVGCSDLTKSTMRYMDFIQPGCIRKEHLQLANSSAAVYNFQVPSSRYLFPEGHPAREALDDIDQRGDVHEHLTEHNAQPIVAYDRVFATHLALYKGVTSSTLKNSTFFVDKHRRYVGTPAYSLLASSIRHSDCTFQCKDEQTAASFSPGQDMNIIIPVKYANELRTSILEKADRLRKTCMRDVRALPFNFAIRFTDQGEDWRYDEERQQIFDVRNRNWIDLDAEFHVRLGINMNVLYVAVDTQKSMSVSYNHGHMLFPDVWRKEDVLAGTGAVARGATPVYSPAKQKDGERKRVRDSLEKEDNVLVVDDDDGRVVAASSVPAEE